MSAEYGDARHWTGDDDREFGIDPDEEHCPDCGVGPLDECLPECGCRTCREREWKKQDAARERA